MGLIRAPIYFILGYIYMSFIDKLITPENINKIPLVGLVVSKENVKKIRENDGMHIVIFMTLVALIF